MDFKSEITRLKRVVHFLNRTSTTIINNLVTTLTALTDVDIYEPTTGEVLIYNEVTQKWENGPQSGGGGTPGGSNTQLQYNNAGAFGGISGATTNGTILSVTTAAAGTNTTQAASTAFVQTALAGGQNVGSNLFLYYNFY